MSLRSFIVVVSVLASVSLACSKKATRAPAPAPIAKAVTIDDEPGAKLDPNDPKHGTRKLMNLDAPVYVDGAQVGVLRYGDLAIAPASMLGENTPMYRVYDYVKSLGVAPESMKSVHFHGNNDRISSIEGSELLKEKDRFQFKFSDETTGAALQRWDTEGLKNEFVGHEFRRVTIYVHKAAPAIHPQRRCHLAADGECTDQIPYAQGDAAKGTRVYVDGKMVGFVKRRQVGGSMLLGDNAEGEHMFSVAKLVASFGVDLTNVKAVELVAGDDVIGRADRLAADLSFTLPKHNHGKVRVHVPASMQAQDVSPTDRDALVSSVVVFKNVTPPRRELSAISEETDLSVQVASVGTDARDGHGRGEN